MKQLYTITLMLLIALHLFAQHEPIQPYEDLGIKVKVLTLSNGKYQESFPNDTLHRIGSVLFNRVTGEVETVVIDTILGEYSLRADVPSRWLSPDPLVAKFPEWSPYTGMGDNPIIFIDPDGRQIDVSSIKKTHSDEWEKTKQDLEELTGLKLTVGDKGFLTYEKSKGKLSGSRKARRYLIKAIKHKDVITVRGCDDCLSVTVENDFVLDVEQIKGFIKNTSKDLDDMTYGFGMNFLHEMGHTDVKGNKRDQNGSVVGNNIRFMNEIRKQMGEDFGERLNHGAMQVEGQEEDNYVPFSEESLNSIKEGKVPERRYVKEKKAQDSDNEKHNHNH